MRLLCQTLFVLMAMSLTVPAFGASKSDRDDCRQNDDQDRRIAGCTRMIDDTSETPHARAVAHNLRGNALRGKGDNDRALADYEAAIRLDPLLAFPHVNRGIIWRGRGEIDRSIAEYSTAIGLDPKYAFAYANRGFALLDRRQNERAMADCDKAIELAPNAAIGYSCRGSAWRMAGENDRAMADCETAIKLAPKYAGAYSCRGLVRSSKGDHDQAIADFTEAITLSPRYAFAYLNRGRDWARKADYDHAIADYTEAISIDPGLRLAYRDRGNAWSMKGDNAQATADYAEAKRRAPKPAGSGMANEIARGGSPQQVAVATVPPPPKLAMPAAPAGRRVALVIGNSAYRSVAALPNPQKDAESVAATLRSIGFATVITKNNASRQDIVAALKSFEDEAENSDWAVIYYAGHGIEIGGINYLVPVDARLKDDRDVQDEAVPLERVLASVESARKLRLVILDACRDNPFAVAMRRGSASRSVSRGLGSIEPDGGVLVAYAAKHGQVAFDGDGASSPFAHALVTRLTTPNLEISMLFRMVRDDVLNATDKKQEPFVYGSLPGESLFFVQK